MDQGRIQRHQLNKCYPVLKDKWKSINNVINIFFLKSRLFLREGSPLLWTCVNHRVSNIGSLWKKLRFPSRQRAKVERQGQLGSARAQPPVSCSKGRTAWLSCESTFQHVTGNKRNSLTTLMFLCSPSKILVSLRQTLKLSLRTSSTHNAKASWGLLRIWLRAVT